MDGPRHKFFAHAAFTGDQHGSVRIGHPFDHLKDLLHGKADADNIFKLVFVFQTTPENRVLADDFVFSIAAKQICLEGEAPGDIVALQKTMVVHRRVYRCQDFFKLERLQNIIEGAASHSADSALHTPITRHDDAEGAQVFFLNEIDELETVHLGHHQISNENLVTVILQGNKRLFAVNKGINRVTIDAQELAEHGENILFILHNNDFTFARVALHPIAHPAVPSLVAYFLSDQQ